MSHVHARRAWKKPELRSFKAGSAEGKNSIKNCDNSGQGCGSTNYRS